MREIGSEFWSVNIDNGSNNLEYFNIGKDNQLLMSGRGAINYIIKEININNGIVYMPNYCCESMIEPFTDNNYKIEYYDVDVINNNYKIDINKKCDIFFAMSYFGYNESNMDKYIEIFSKRKVIVIEDITHRLLCNNNYCKYSTYLVASIRKWFPILTGGLAVNLNNKFTNKINDYQVNKELINKKKKAMDLKRDYINNKLDMKDEFLKLYSESNDLFKEYSNKKMDNLSLQILNSIDINVIRKIRINNVKLIERRLKDNNIQTLYKLKKGDCPLFVPIIINNRNDIRKKLIDNNIYCPIHWPNFNNFDNDIYDIELSLICDQRYGSNDISEYINKLIDIVGE